jgi:hypothetical protein
MLAKRTNRTQTKTTKYKKRNHEFWKWGLWLCVSGITFAIGWSINHLTPGLLPIALAMCGGAAIASFVYAVYLTHISPTLRYRAWICEGALIVGAVLNLSVHAVLSRRFDVAQQARQARYVEETRKEKLEQAALDRKKQAAETDAALMRQQAAMLRQQQMLTDAQNRQLDKLPRSQRRQLAPASSAIAATGTTQAAASPADSPVAPLPEVENAQAQATVQILTPEQIQEQAWLWVLLGILSEAGLLGFTIIFFGRGLIGDANGNGIPDWAEELDEEYLLENHPEYYRRLYGEPPEVVGDDFPLGRTGNTLGKR